jgi:hypothetical protein
VTAYFIIKDYAQTENINFTKAFKHSLITLILGGALYAGLSTYISYKPLDTYIDEINRNRNRYEKILYREDDIPILEKKKKKFKLEDKKI